MNSRLSAIALLGSLLLALGMEGTLGAAPIAISSATGTYDQGAPFTIASTIDNVLGGSNGWGVFGGQFVTQSAVYTATAPVTASQLGFTLLHETGFGDHNINEFRISVTADPVPSLGGSWTSLAPTFYRSTATTLLNVGGGNVRSIGSGGGRTNYYLGAAAPFANITGFRLELVPYDYNPADALAASLGRASNGNLVLSEFQAETGINRAFAAPAISSGATYPGYPPANIVDGNPNTFSHPDTGATLGYYYGVDLGQTFSLERLELRNRTDGCCPERLSNYRVTLMDSSFTPLWSGTVRGDGSNSGVGGTDVVTPLMGTGTFAGRYVVVENLSGNAYNPQISEVKAFSAPASASARVPLQEATATFHQGNFGSVDQTIDGNPLGGGMGFYNNRSSNTLIAWETQSDLSGPGLLTFTINANSGGFGHSLQRFRLAATGADRSLFADGNPPNGAEGPAGDTDVSPAAFALLTPVSAVSRNGATLTIGPNNVITVSGAVPEFDTYVITARSPLATITGFRLEALPGPNGYVGRSFGTPFNSNGNAVLTEFDVEFAPGGGLAGKPTVEVPLRNATATFDQGAPFTIASAIDGIEHGDNGWAVFGQQNQNQNAVFQTFSPIFATDLVFELNQTSLNIAHKLQRFRLSATTDPNPTATDSAIHWFQLQPTDVFTTLAGSTAVINPDNTISISGANGVPDTYQVLMHGNFGGVTGFRLEALTGPNGALGFPGHNGNIVLSEFNVFASVPEPSSLALAALGLLGLGLVAWRRRR